MNASDEAFDFATADYLTHIQDMGGIIDIRTMEGLTKTIAIMEQLEDVHMVIVYRRTNG